MEKIREIINKACNRYYNNETSVNEILDQAHSAIMKVIGRMIPKEYQDIKKSEASQEIKEYMRGYNQCITQFKQNLKEA